MPLGIITGAGKGDIIMLLGVGMSLADIVSFLWSGLGESLLDEQQLFSLGFGGLGTEASVIGTEAALSAFLPPQQEPIFGVDWTGCSSTCVAVIESDWLAMVVFELSGLIIGGCIWG
jgi:hypothetical protein